VALEVHGDDGVPLLLAHVDEEAVAQDARVVHEDVQLAEGVQRRLHQPLGARPFGHVVGVGHGLAAEADDLVHHLLGGDGVGVVDHDPGAFTGEEQRVLPAQAPACAGDDRHPAVQRSHGPTVGVSARRAPPACPA
jgi:hypothetical protein